MKNLHKDLQWSKDVLNQHKDKPTIIVSHDVIYPKVKIIKLLPLSRPMAD